MENSSKRPRRDDQMQYDRIVELKLGFIPAAFLTTIVAADGLTTPKMYIMAEMHSCYFPLYPSPSPRDYGEPRMPSSA